MALDTKQPKGYRKAWNGELGKPRAAWMIRVTDRQGNDMYLRRGSRVGYGPIVRFTTKNLAELNAESMIAPGLDAGDVVTVVPYDKDEE